ncbi:MAG: M48 family metalloprotease, partial [Phycisphaerae bacterium]|nr:M48 family metalloprotease [Phycisphaerae bacterium]
DFPCWSRWQYITFSLRHHVLFIAVPICLIILGVDIIKLYIFPLLGNGEGAKWAAACMILCVVGGVFLIAPLLVVKVWKTRPLPAGATRQSLEEMCRRMGVRYRNILVWISGGVLANAGAMGLISPVRYLLLSDALLSNSSPEHIRAIFAHEVAHIRQHHIFYSAMFAVSSILLCSFAAWGLISLCGLLPWPIPPVVAETAEATLMMVLLAGTWAWGFGFISKRFERQSDVIGAWTSGLGRPPSDAADTSIDPAGAEQFAGALEQVARLNGIPLRQRNWRHGRMADRIDYIRSLGNGGSREPIDRLVRRIKILLWAGLILGVALTVWEILARPAV